MQETLDFLMRHGYVVLFVFVFAEQIGVPLPAIPFLLAAGALARGGQIELLPAIAVAAAAALLSDAVWYEIGRRKGVGVLRWLCRLSLEPDSCVRTTENFFSRHGARALLVAKFVPGLNTAAPPLAGVLRMHPLRFAAFDLAGALLWIGLFFALGYAFTAQLEQVAAWAVGLGGLVGLLLFGPLAAYLGWKFFRRRRTLREIGIGRISAGELNGLLREGAEITVVDLRHGLAAAADPHTIPGALHLPAEELEQRHGEIPRNREIVLFCT